MAVEFISSGYDTTVDNPYTENVWADAHPSIGSASYGVRGADDWKVSAVAGQDRTVSIAAGKGFGRGVTDETVENETIQLNTISSGSRWDLIACRRDWTPTAGISKFVKVTGGSSAVIPGGRLDSPGALDDQPIALVKVTAGQTQPTSFIDLRTWTGDGGGLVANHDLVRSYMDAPGTRIFINETDWLRVVGTNGNEEWVRGTFPPRVDAGQGSDQAIVKAGEIYAVTTSYSTGRVVFDTAFPNACKAITLTSSTGALTAVTFRITARAKTYAEFVAYGPNGAGLPGSGIYLNYVAVGH